MPRPAKLWRRKGREGWWATVAGKQVCFGADREEANEAFHAAKAEHAARAKGQGRSKPSGRVLVAVAIDRYLDAVHESIKPKTFEIYRSALQHWSDRYGRMTLDAMTADHFRAWLKRPGWSKSTQSVYGAAVKTFVKWSVREKLLAADPFANVRLPGYRPRKGAEPGAIEAVMSASNAAFRDFLVVCLETGCRPGEVRTLTADSIDWDRNTAIVSGKTGERLIGLSAKALGVLRAYAEKYPEGPVLRTQTGLPWTEANLKKCLQVARDKVGLKKGQVVLYHCRHAFWTRATKAGVSDVAVSKQLGHTDLRMLTKVYSHADHQIMAETARKAGGEE
jgi:integrase